MALIIPVSFTTFADATATEGGRLRKYVLAQFRGDAELAWVARLRARVNRQELKWLNVKESRPALRRERSLWKTVEQGVAQAALIVIDPEPIDAQVRATFGRQSAGDAEYEQEVVGRCATALVRATPIAYLPQELNRWLGGNTPWLRAPHS